MIIYQPIFGELLIVIEIKKVIHKRSFSQKRVTSPGKKGLILLSSQERKDCRQRTLSILLEGGKSSSGFFNGMRWWGGWLFFTTSFRNAGWANFFGSFIVYILDVILYLQLVPSWSSFLNCIKILSDRLETFPFPWFCISPFSIKSICYDIE